MSWVWPHMHKFMWHCNNLDAFCEYVTNVLVSHYNRFTLFCHFVKMTSPYLWIFEIFKPNLAYEWMTHSRITPCQLHKMHIITWTFSEIQYGGVCHIEYFWYKPYIRNYLRLPSRNIVQELRYPWRHLMTLSWTTDCPRNQLFMPRTAQPPYLPACICSAAGFLMPGPLKSNYHRMYTTNLHHIFIWVRIVHLTFVLRSLR